MIDCSRERETQHHRKWRGFGPVQDHERVVLAVFASTPRNALNLVPNSFDRVRDDSQSTVRIDYVSMRDLNRKIITPGIETKGDFIGVASAHVSDIRGLVVDVNIGHQTRKVRLVCVLDLVEPGDVDGHAILGFADPAPIRVSPKQLKIMRQTIRMDMANAFTQIRAPGDYDWPNRFAILKARIFWIIRLLRCTRK